MSINFFKKEDVPTPAANQAHLFIDPDNVLKWKDSDGVFHIPNEIWDGMDTQANILALNPTTHLGQSWFATDTKIVYKALINNLGLDVWQGITVQYDEDTDTFQMTPTQDGQTQNIGREIFFIAFNNDGSGGAALDPKVFLSIGSKVDDEEFQDVLLATAGDLQQGAVFGLNTTSLQPTEKGKIVTYGILNGVNTSMWLINDILFVDSTTAGDLTNIQPAISAFVVAKVLKVDATEGTLFINTVSSNRVDTAEVPVGVDRIYLTADEITLSTTFYETKREDQGIIAEATEIVSVPDNSTVGATQDHISILAIADFLSAAGLKRAFIDFSHDTNGGSEKVHIEVYDADANGVPIDSGIVTETITDFPGVRPVLVMSTALLNNTNNTIFHEECTGLLSENFTFITGNRILIHIRCEKVGAAGGTKDFTLYFGSDHNSYIESLSRLETSLQDAYNVGANITTGPNGPMTVRLGALPATTNVFAVESILGADVFSVTGEGKINIQNMPTSSAGLSSGDLWNNSGVVNII